MRLRTYIKVVFFCLFFPFSTVFIRADEKKFQLIIAGNGGVETDRVSVSDIRKIEFADDVIIIREKSSTERSVMLSGISKIYFSKDGSTGIFTEKVSTEEVKVYPNPATNNIIIAFQMPGTQPVLLMGINGMIYYRNNSFYSGETIDISSFSPGIYILRIADKNIKFQKR